MVLVCRQCSTQFTLDLRPVPFDPRIDAVEEDFLNRGELMQAEKSFYFETDAGSFIANIADTHHMKLTSDSIRLQGCCGLDGANGPNLQCEVCDTYVATRRSDCWTPHYVLFDPNTTMAVEDPAAEAGPTEKPQP
jgi:hypothetical protein